jgi:putative nucleotidyltransferase with HDIG domain
MHWYAKAYIWAVAVAAAVFLNALERPFVPRDIEALFSILAFVSVGCLAEAMAIDFRLGKGRQAKSSLAFLPFLSSLAIFPPATAVIIVMTVVAVSQILLRRNDLYRATFNISQAALAIGIAALTYQGVGHAPPEGQIVIPGFVIASAVFFGSNILLNSIAIAILRSEDLSVVLRQVAGTKGGNLWYDLLGLFMIVLPLLLIRYSYLSKIQLEEANRDLLRVLVKAIETRDPYTSGHSVRVSTLARQVAIDLQLRHGIVQDVEIAALLHDIGKIEPAYADLIKKPHDLDVGERELIRTHATRGADILASLTSVKREVIEAVRFHHEKYDGTGYPNGLVGERIPVAARIIMLCDSVDAMLSDRPYRKALTVEQTRSELVKYSGSQFDPLIVDTVLSKNTLEKALGLVAESARDSAAPEETQPAMVVMASAG